MHRQRFDLETLCVVQRRDPADEAVRLKVALGAGLLCQLEGANYKFSHDRVQQAVYSLIPENDRASVHLEIGRLLLASAPEDQREERIFDITNQLNSGRSVITDREAQIELAKLNLQAGNRAKLNSAFPTAFDYFETGISLVELGVKPWKEAPTLMRELLVKVGGGRLSQRRIRTFGRARLHVAHRARRHPRQGQALRGAGLSLSGG